MSQHYIDPEPAEAFYPERIDSISWKIDRREWTPVAIRHILRTFAYGGPASASDLERWSKMAPDIAIKEILHLAPYHEHLSPLPHNSKSRGQIDLGLISQQNASLTAMAEYLTSGRSVANIRADRGIDQWALASRTWCVMAIHPHHNPFRHKIGLFESNYHMAVNRHTEVQERQIFSYYDTILAAHSDGRLSYDKVIARAALSAAIASQYRHRENRYHRGAFLGNEDFGRELFQLFFRIPGYYAADTNRFPAAFPEQPLGASNNDYHEYTTIRNTARALSGTEIPAMARWPWDTPNIDKVRFADKFNGGWPEDEIEILGATIAGKNSSEKIEQLCQNAINHEESLRYLPVYIIQTLADDNLLEDGNEPRAVKEKLNIIRALWGNFRKESDYNLLRFLRMYAISRAFHTKERWKYRTSLDRYTHSARSVAYNDKLLLQLLPLQRSGRDQVHPFEPIHDVFGHQSGFDAAFSADIFRNGYTTASRDYWYLSRTREGERDNPTWLADYSEIIPPSFVEREEGRRAWRTRDVAEWLWLRYIGDLKSFGITERMQLYALVSSGRDFAWFIAGNRPSRADLNRTFAAADLRRDSALRKQFDDLERGLLILDGSATERSNYSDQIHLAINFLTALPHYYLDRSAT